ncbi:MAG: hypothetical protein V1892_03700 [bacterium]
MKKFFAIFCVLSLMLFVSGCVMQQPSKGPAATPKTPALNQNQAEPYPDSDELVPEEEEMDESSSTEEEVDENFLNGDSSDEEE